MACGWERIRFEITCRLMPKGGQLLDPPGVLGDRFIGLV